MENTFFLSKKSRFLGEKFAFSEFNCVDLCHDAAKHAGMMALAAPSVVSRLIIEK
jgi:hypothetical protein